MGYAIAVGERIPPKLRTHRPRGVSVLEWRVWLKPQDLYQAVPTYTRKVVQTWPASYTYGYECSERKTTARLEKQGRPERYPPTTYVLAVPYQHRIESASVLDGMQLEWKQINR